MPKNFRSYTKKKNEIKNISEKAKGYIIEKNQTPDLIELKYILSLTAEADVLVRIDNQSANFNNRIKKYKFKCNDGDINTVKFAPENSGSYIVTVAVMGRPVLKEVFYVNDVNTNYKVIGSSKHTMVIRYGVYGLDKEGLGDGVSLTPQSIDRRAELGSYFGITYRLNNELYNSKIDVTCNVRALNGRGEYIIDETWNDVAFHDKLNNFAYIIEEEKELLQGPWLFTLEHDKKIILIKEFKIKI